MSVRLLSLLLSLVTTACGNSAAPLSAAPAPEPEPPAALCVSSSCGSKTVLLTIPDAENLLFTPEGRLFVSGGVNVYEVRRDAAGAYSATPLLAGSCNFTGLALRGQVLYANCFDGQLYAAALTVNPVLQPIHTLGLASPNGLATGPEGELYVVNGPLATSALPNPKIVRLTLSPTDPFTVVEQTDWLPLSLLGSQPNGVQVQGRTLYFSESAAPSLGRIQRVPINADGSPGTPEVLTRFNSLPDDFSLAGSQLLAAGFTSGRVSLYDATGALVAETDANTFSFPSAVRLGQPPLFAASDVLVTEKGILGDNNSAIGNVLSVFRAQ